MNKRLSSLAVLLAAAQFCTACLAADAAAFVRLSPLPAPKIVAGAEEFPGGRYKAVHLLDGKPKTEFASRGKGTGTFVEFDLGAPVRIAAFRHQDRNDVATIAASELRFSDAAGKPVAAVPVEHVNQRGGATFFVLPQPVAAQRVRWQVTKLGSKAAAVGGAEIVFYTSGEAEPAPRGIGIEAQAEQVIQRTGNGEVQPLRITLDYPYASPADTVVRLDGQEPRPVRLTFGSHVLDYTTTALKTGQPLHVALDYAGKTAAERTIALRPARKTTIYILPHSHTDIGYTEIQTAIEQKQVNNLLQGIEYARQTATYPQGARFVWNVEVLWAADLYLRRLSPAQRADFFAAVRSGQVALNGMYLNELTGLCRPEELLQLFRYSTKLAEQCGVAIDAAMISDVPGYTWGTVTAMAHSGIKYFSVAPNYFDRIGDILVQWENKPFYWLSPSGQEKVLVWIPYRGYALSHMLRKLAPEFVGEFQTQLDRAGYPYDIAYLRWSGHGDNAVPDPSICEFVRDWNEKYLWPKFIISSTSEAFRALEQRCGERLPHVRGDWTPYWEDGAGSSALETAVNRASSDRLTQAAALWAMLRPARYPAAEFEDAWRNVLLYSEHTWGASGSITQPDSQRTSEQWEIKRSYALQADKMSRQLLARGLEQREGAADGSAVDVFNTTSWPRSELLVLPKALSLPGDHVADAEGRPVPSQRLRSGELALVARDVPPLAAKRFHISAEAPHVQSQAVAQGAQLDNALVRVRIDQQTGGIVELRANGIPTNLADVSSGRALNDYLYLIGDDPADLQRSGPARITVQEHGPLVASLKVESDAPGCNKLMREVRLVAGSDCVELIDTVDKQRLAAKDYRAKEGKESVHFAFPFHVPQGQMRLDLPLALMRPEHDQMPSACKNWLTVGRWADVANEDYGVTWVTLDAPLVEVGAVTATLLNSQTDPAVWRKTIEPTQTLYCWAMNNHWGTNYRAYQEGPTTFRFVLCPHRRFSPADASRLAIGLSQPLIASQAKGPDPGSTPRLRLDCDDVLLTALKPSDDGKAWIVRLFGAAGKAAEVTISWAEPGPKQLWLSDTSERPLQKIAGAISVPAWGLVTVRADR
jgi:hypothetical protein